MVKTVGPTPSTRRVAESAPLVVELVGVAGSGKSTLARALSQHSERVRLALHPYFRRPGHIPFFIRHGLSLAPTLLRLRLGSTGRCTPRQIACMIILNGWHRWFRRRALKRGTIVVLDQGPIALLAELYGLGPEWMRSEKAAKWWDRTFSRWADALDIVLWLDAPDRLLLERIRARQKWHMVKGLPDAEALNRVIRYRAAYKQVMIRLTSNSTGPKVVRFDTAQACVDGTLDRFLQVLGLGGSEDIPSNQGV